MTARAFKDAAPSMESESDLDLARAAMPTLLKTVEGLALVSPENPTLLEFSAKAACGYAFAGPEDELEQLADTDPRREPLRQSATLLYRRCRDYAVRLLALSDPAFPGVFARDVPTFEAAVARVDDRDAVPGMYWTALGLASEINLNREDLVLVGELSRVQILLRQVLKLDPEYSNGGAHLALGGIFAGQSRALGGNPEEGRKHLETAIALTKGRFLFNRVVLARIYAVTVQDRPLYERTLKEVLAAPADIMPEQRFANEMARRKAARYLKMVDELF